MAVTLFYGKKPPARGRILLGEQMRDDDWRAIAQLNTELWAQAGENLGGLIYDRTPWQTSLTSFNIGSGWSLDRWQPIANMKFRHVTTDQTTLFYNAYVRNADIQIQVFNGSWTLLSTTSVNCTSNTPQWLQNRVVLTGLNTSEVRIFQLQARRNSFAADATVYHFGAKAGATAAAQVPVS